MAMIFLNINHRYLLVYYHLISGLLFSGLLLKVGMKCAESMFKKNLVNNQYPKNQNDGRTTKA
jgi:hypothetical protein